MTDALTGVSFSLTSPCFTLQEHAVSAWTKARARLTGVMPRLKRCQGG